MKLYTSRFGEIEIDEDKVIIFHSGLLGFADVKHYVLLDNMNNPDIPFKWLQAVNEPDLVFVVIDPLLLCPDYNSEIDEHVLRELNMNGLADCCIFVIVTIPHEMPEMMTANLQGPLIVNLKTGEAKQFVLLDDKYPLRYPLLQDIPVSNP
ncbi:MAG: flagellar assembly protein FliW [Nitrospirae bacterium]|nr:flagellar assembly protein FliW [Nitrospirota bacterium]